ncbi:hypothetical protein Tco_0670147 [Tanacetum coccineum]
MKIKRIAKVELLVCDVGFVMKVMGLFVGAEVEVRGMVNSGAGNFNLGEHGTFLKAKDMCNQAHTSMLDDKERLFDFLDLRKIMIFDFNPRAFKGHSSSDSQPEAYSGSLYSHDAHDIDQDSRFDICMDLLLKNIDIVFKQSKFSTSRDRYVIERELKEYEDSSEKSSIQVFYKELLNQYHRVQDLSSATYMGEINFQDQDQDLKIKIKLAFENADFEFESRVDTFKEVLHKGRYATRSSSTFIKNS